MKKTYIKPTMIVEVLNIFDGILLTMSDPQHSISAGAPDDYSTDQDGYVDSNSKGNSLWDEMW